MGDVRVSDDLRDRVTEALTREHYRRAGERIAASPEEHSAAMADVAMGVLADQDVGGLCAPIAQTAVVRPGDTLIVRVPTGSTRDAVDRMLEGLRQNLPDVAALVVAAEELAIYRLEAPRFEITAGPDVTPEQAERFARSMQRSESMRRTA